jgi:hypothetical protein
VATLWGDAFVASAASQDATGEVSSEANAATGISAPARRVVRLGQYGEFELMFVAAR